MEWDYAKLSKAAKEAGGPEKLMDLLVESGRQKGHKEMAPIIIGAITLALFVGGGATSLINNFKKKRISKQGVESAKKELIQGIKTYDNTHFQSGIQDDTSKEEKYIE